MKGFKKMDEMNIQISYLSVRFSYAFTLIVLFIWAAICIHKNDNQTFSKIIAILLTQYFILIILHFYYSRKMSGKF